MFAAKCLIVAMLFFFREPLHAAELNISRLACTVISSTLPSFPRGALAPRIIRRNDQISSSGFLPNFLIQNPRLVSGFFGNTGITGNGCIPSLLGPLSYDVTLEFAKPLLLEGPARFTDITLHLLTPLSSIRLSAPDAILECSEIEFVNAK